MEKVKPVILMICDYYLPGFESGGAMRTLVNMIERFGDDYQFNVLTRDHDGPLNKTPYTSVRINEWNRIGDADVYYLSKDNIRPGSIKKIICRAKPDAVYLNSFFSPLTVFTLMLRRFNMIAAIPIVLAPEGELVPGALSIKPLKKRLYIRLAKLLGLLRNIVWKAASEFERGALENIFGTAEKIFIAPNMPPRTILSNFDLNAKPEKIRGLAKMIFLSRFMRKKNFNWLLDVVRNTNGDLSIDIYGPIEDAEYWEKCQKIIETLPDNIRIDAKGAVSHEKAAATLAQYHFFILPTLGENFGHIVIEALAAGCPLIISDRSPWRDLKEQGIGWDIPLEDPEEWRMAIDACLEMANDEYRKMSANAREYAMSWLADPENENSNREVLEFALLKNSRFPTPEI